MKILKNYALVGLILCLLPLTISPLFCPMESSKEETWGGYISTKTSWLTLAGILALDNRYTKTLLSKDITPALARSGLTLVTAGLVGLNAMQMYYTWNEDTKNKENLGNRTLWQSGWSFVRGLATLGVVYSSLKNNTDLKWFAALSCASMLPALFYHGFPNLYKQINDLSDNI